MLCQFANNIKYVYKMQRRGTKKKKGLFRHILLDIHIIKSDFIIFADGIITSCNMSTSPVSTRLDALLRKDIIISYILIFLK